MPFGLIDALMILVTVLWGLNGVAIKYAITQFSPVVFNAIRFTYASALIFLVLWLMEWRKAGRQAVAAAATGVVARKSILPSRSVLPSRSDFRVLIIAGLLGNFVYQLFYINGIHLSTAGNTSFVMATTPVSIAVLSSLVGLERLNRRVWLGIMVSWLGVVVVSLGAQASFSFSSISIRGDVLSLLATFCWAGYNILSKPLLGDGNDGGDANGAGGRVGRCTPTALTSWTMLAGTIALDLYAIPQLIVQDWSVVTPLAWACLIFSGALGLVGPYIVWNYGLQRLGPARTGTYQNLTPITTGVFAFFLLAERWTALRFAGVAVILAGVALVRQGGKTAPRQSPKTVVQ